MKDASPHRVLSCICVTVEDIISIYVGAYCASIMLSYRRADECQSQINAAQPIWSIRLFSLMCK